jgi:hypothetical protein
MSPLEWILVADAVALVVIAIGSGITDGRAAGAWRPVIDAGWAPRRSLPADEASPLPHVIYLNGRAPRVAAATQPPRRARRARGRA